MDDNSAPATKADIDRMMDFMSEIYDHNKKLLKCHEDWKDEIIRHFDIKVGQIRHDLMGANRDEISSLIDTKEKHEKRITRLEEQAGLVSMF